MHKRTILIDLDGVLNEYKSYNENEIPIMKKGAPNFLKQLSQNFELVLFTTRSLKMAHRWLIDNNIDVYFKDITNVKIAAYLILDDRAVCFDGNFDNILAKIVGFKPYWKN